MIMSDEQEEHFRAAFAELLEDYNAIQLSPVEIKIKSLWNEKSGLLLADSAKFTIED